MHSKVKPLSLPPKEPDYPCIKEGRLSHNIVLFTGPDTGIVLGKTAGGSGAGVVGYQSTSWSEPEFKPFHGEITIFTEN